jgi:SNF family Na+-dependent transporter
MSDAPVSDAPSCASPGSFLYSTTLLAASVGFINIMNFQSLAYQYNGGAFFLAYLIVLLVIGMPLVQLETGLGVIFSKQGSGQAAAFNAVSPHFR